MASKGFFSSGLAVSIIVGVLALGGLLAVFVSNASPYVTVAEARKSKADNLHVAGEIVKESLVNDIQNHQMRFDIKDASGETLKVVYSGEPLSNINSANKVVAIGGMDGQELRSKQVLMKCPTRYEAAKPTY